MRTACVLALIAACASTSTGGSPTTPPPSAPEDVHGGSGALDLPRQGQPCNDGKCAPGLRCLSYFGVAGPRGPSFSSCEIPCLDARAICPEGQTCATVADGPGRVCGKKP
jgi:hypothetical protein